MLQILFMILKILGILLLVVLGIILAVLLLVLFVPLRYRADAVFDGKPQGGVLVSWLLHLVTVRVNYDGSIKALVKVLWFRLFDKTVWPAEEPEISEGADVTESVAAAETMKEAAPVENVEAAETMKTVETGKIVESVKPEQPEQTVGAAKPEKTVDTVNTASTEHTDDAVQKTRLESLIEKVVSLIQTAFTKISCAYQQICGKVDAEQEKIELARTFLADQENRNTLHLLWKQVKKLFCHILPRRIGGRIRFGFDDPATTGQILTYVSPFYGLYAKTLELEPVFDEKVVEGELHVKGHIRVASLLWIVIRVFLNKNFRVLLKKIMAMGKK